MHEMRIYGAVGKIRAMPGGMGVEEIHDRLVSAVPMDSGPRHREEMGADLKNLNQRPGAELNERVEQRENETAEN